MRVIAGVFRGRTLDAPPGRGTRPMTDRLRETLFNILGHRFGTPGGLPAVAVLDVFAGSGSLGIEALSRGAGRCVFVEHHPRALRALRGNLQRLHLEGAAAVLTDNAWSMRAPEVEGGFGLVFLDPPFAQAEPALRLADLLERLAPRLAPQGVLVLRLEARTAFAAADLRSLACADERTYRRSRLLFLTRPSGPAAAAGGGGAAGAGRG